MFMRFVRGPPLVSSGVIAIGSGYQVCALKSGGAVWCWGNAAAPAGNNGIFFNSWSKVPTQVAGLPVGIQGLAQGTPGGAWSHNCAWTTYGIWCWGGNSQGQLGNGNTTDSPTPVKVQGLPSGVVSWVAVGNWQALGHTCAVVGGHTYCWSSQERSASTTATSGTASSRFRPWGCEVGSSAAGCEAPHLDQVNKRTKGDAMNRSHLALLLLGCCASSLGFAISGCEGDDEGVASAVPAPDGGATPKDATTAGYDGATSDDGAAATDTAAPPELDATTDGGTRTDGGAEGGAVAEAGGSNPGQVTCGTTTCGTTQFCCNGPDGGCTDDGGTCIGLANRCDESADCPAGQACCFNIAGAACQAGGCQIQLCKATSECADSGADGGCGPQSCLDQMVSVCGRPFGCGTP